MFRCAECHGTQGEGTAEAPPLNDFLVLPPEFIESQVRSGPENMSAFTEAEISAEQLTLLSAHIQAEIAGTNLVSVDEDQLEQGRQLWRDFCMECHGARGQGKNDFGPPLNVWPPYSVTGIIDGARLPLPDMPVLSVTDDELRLIAAFMHSWAANSIAE
ncbi:MAG: hypothetical protein HC915_05280 [Anaerolineae bacterium]|nr:hypothetical protein [Anaerolineae bacterium]